MYKCEMCGRVTPANQAAIKRVIKCRSVEYPSRTYRMKGRNIHDPGGNGLEAVKEVNLCADCVLWIDTGRVKEHFGPPQPDLLATPMLESETIPKFLTSGI